MPFFDTLPAQIVSWVDLYLTPGIMIWLVVRWWLASPGAGNEEVQKKAANAGLSSGMLAALAAVSFIHWRYPKLGTNASASGLCTLVISIVTVLIGAVLPVLLTKINNKEQRSVLWGIGVMLASGTSLCSLVLYYSALRSVHQALIFGFVGLLIGYRLSYLVSLLLGD